MISRFPRGSSANLVRLPSPIRVCVRALSQLRELVRACAWLPAGQTKIRPSRWEISLRFFESRRPVVLARSPSIPCGFGRIAVLRRPLLGLRGFLPPAACSSSCLGNVGFRAAIVRYGCSSGLISPGMCRIRCSGGGRARPGITARLTRG
jgi:hypothetical protein